MVQMWAINVSILCFLFFVVLRTTDGFGTAVARSRTTKLLDPLKFKQRGNGGDDDNNDKGGWFSSWKARIASLFQEPSPDTGNRYHIRIKDVKGVPQRHVITRLIRYFPDLTWETAEDIVETCLVNEVALVRIVNSLREAEYAADMLRKADPPIPSEIYDSKKEEILQI